MIPYQRVALYILFDSIEADLLAHISSSINSDDFLTELERDKCLSRLAKRSNSTDFSLDDNSLVTALDLGDKFDVLLRNKNHLGDLASYFLSKKTIFDRIISVRNDIMHGRPLTIDQQVIALAFAQELLNSPGILPRLARAYSEYSDSPAAFIERSISFLDEDYSVSTCLHNLPVPDFDDTGWLPRPDLEQDLKKKLLGRHPVISILGDGGNGKTALALQVLHNLVRTNDHEFDAIIWTSAKATALTVYGIKEIEDATVDALDVLDAAAILEPVGDSARDRIEKFLRNNKVLLVVDNYETIVGDDIQLLAQDVPGASKLLFTSRHPIGGDLPVNVGELSPKDAMNYFHRLISVYGLRNIYQTNDQSDFERWLDRLNYKPLSIKWLVLGMKSGLNGEAITSDPDTVLKFCLENVIEKLGDEAQAVIYVLATLPVPLSPSIIHEVSGLKSLQVIDGISELNRFNLIEAKVTDDGSQVFAVRPFAKNYIHRLVRPKNSVAEEIVKRFQSIESEFQLHRFSKSTGNYSLRNYHCSNRSQMLLARDLRRAVDFAYEQAFDRAEALLEECKRLDPGYFENHKAESVIAWVQNDLPRAIEAAKVAITLDDTQAKLHYLLGTHYVRLNEPKLAAECFERAIALKPDFHPFREAARNEMIRYQFDAAQHYLDKAREYVVPGTKDALHFTDMVLQLHARRIDDYVKSEKFETAITEIKSFHSLIANTNDHEFDDTTINHVMKIVPTITEIRRNFPADSITLDFLVYLENRFISKSGNRDFDDSVVVDKVGEHFGYLKKFGLKPDYGFICSETAPDAFIHITTAGYGLWIYLMSDGAVTFDVESQGDGKYRAVNVKAALT